MHQSSPAWRRFSAPRAQERINNVFPPAVNAAGDSWLEFVATLPTEGKYAGQPCALCNVRGCPMYGRLFHQKNLATHGRPRGGGVKSIVFSRIHDSVRSALKRAYHLLAISDRRGWSNRQFCVYSVPDTRKCMSSSLELCCKSWEEKGHAVVHWQLVRAFEDVWM
eukprot:6209422-Pleurochrysis_carterae.AAC.5